MEIDGKDYRVSIIMLMMEDEFLATKITLASLLNSIGDKKGVSISILLNGSEKRKIEDFFKRIKSVNFYSSLDNLGVSGGRNFLLKKPEVISSDIIMVLDNDSFLPTDYVRNMCEFITGHPEAGFINPITLWSQYFTELFDIEKYNVEFDPNRDEVPRLKSSDIKDYWIKNGSVQNLYFMGTYNWFLSHCLATPTSAQNFLVWLKNRKIIREASYLLINEDPSIMEAIKENIDKIESQTTNGGFHVFRSSFILEVGAYESGYNPYGQEDNELSIRALKAGYTNYVNCNSTVLHGTDNRQQVRSHAWKKGVYARRRVINTRKICRSSLIKTLVIVEILVHTVVSSILHNILNKDFTFRSVRSGIRGWWGGLTIRLTDNRELVKVLENAKKKATLIR